MPLPDHHNKNTKPNNVSSQWGQAGIGSPASRIIYITQFNYFQIVNTPNHSVSQSYLYKNKQPIIYSMPNNCSFTLERENWRQSSKTCHENCPSEGCSSRASILPFQIPKKLGSSSVRQLSRKFTLRSSFPISCMGRKWAINRPKQLTPDTDINDNINNEICPQYTDRISCHKQFRKTSNFYFRANLRPSTLRNKNQTKVPDTTISEQSFDVCLCLRSNSSNNHRKCSEQNLSISKRHTPNSVPVMGPKAQNCNFWLNSNPQRYTRPCTHINIRNPKVQRSCRLFPKQSCRNKPDTKRCQLRRIIYSPFQNIFNMRQRSFSCLPINKTNPLKQQTTSKSTQQKILHCCFKRICTFGIQTTKNYLRKTLLFHTKVEGHLVCSHNLLILTNLCLHCQVYIFSMTDSSHFLPSIRNSQYKASSKKQKSTLLQTIGIFLKRTSQKYNMQRTSYSLLKRKKTPSNSPLSQCRSCMIRSSGTNLAVLWGHLRKLRPRQPFVISNKSTQSILFCYCQNFCYRSNKITSTIPKQNKKTKKQEKLRSKKNQIQSHLFVEGGYVNAQPLLQNNNVSLTCPYHKSVYKVS